MAVKKDPFTKATERFHRELLRKVLEESDWNIVESARLLGIRRSKPKPRGGPPKAAAMRTRRG